MTTESVLRAFGVYGLPRIEQEARVGVLDRMGAFSHEERVALTAGGFFSDDRYEDADPGWDDDPDPPGAEFMGPHGVPT